MPYRFYLDPAKSPTYFNLQRTLQEQGWKSTRFKSRAHFSEDHFQFNLKIAQQLEYKHLLTQLVDTYCPDVMMPTYCINDSNWSLVLRQVAEKYYLQGDSTQDQVNNLAWILKPALLNNAQHIKIFQKLSQIEQHFLNTDRMGGEHVLQWYLMQPDLLKGPEKGHKYSLRMFVVLTNYAGAFLYPQGYFNIALKPYQYNDMSDLRSHITNEHFSEEVYNVVQIPTKQYDLFEPFYPAIKTIIQKVFTGLHQYHPQAYQQEKQPKLAIFGFDFIVDSNKRVWLLEVNDAPCFPISEEHPLQKKVYYDFWRAFTQSFVMPIANKQTKASSSDEIFEAVDLLIS